MRPAWSIAFNLRGWHTWPAHARPPRAWRKTMRDFLSMPEVRTSREGDVAVIAVDNPPVNALSHGVPEKIAGAIDALQRDDSVRAIVVMGAGRTFVAGAD